VKVDRAEILISCASPSQFPAAGPPEVAFLGRSNVGKSSLVNALTGRKSLARTSNTPGRTRRVEHGGIVYRVMTADDKSDTMKGQTEQALAQIDEHLIPRSGDKDP
jgi:GTP-binding protein EngB required for normal cell division